MIKLKGAQLVPKKVHFSFSWVGGWDLDGALGSELRVEDLP